MSRITTEMILSATEALAVMLDFGQPADGALSNYFRNHRELGQHERAFVAESAYAVLRRKRSLERLCGEGAKPRQLLLAALVSIQGLSQRQLADAISEADTAWLTQVRAAPDPVLSLPNRWTCRIGWLLNSWRNSTPPKRRSQLITSLSWRGRPGGRANKCAHALVAAVMKDCCN